MNVDIPARVAFVNIKNGSAFFDCSPSEARMAAKIIVEMREKGDENADYFVRYKTMIENAKLMSLKAKVDEKKVVGGLSAYFLSDGFAKIEIQDERVSHIFLNAKDYAWLRKFDRDCLEIETQAYKLKTGMMATLWGAEIVVTRECSEGDIILAGIRDPMDGRSIRKFYRYNLTYDPMSTEGLTPKPKKSSDVEHLEAKLDALMAEVKDLKA